MTKASNDRIRLRVRPALPSDKALVLKFCRHTWRGGDYIPEVWEDWMKERNGKLLVATVNGTPVGVAHAYLQTRSDAWMEGVRVNPEYRGHGIAGRLNKELAAWARRRGAKAARLCTGEDNRASRRHLLKTGFRPLQTFARYVSTHPLKRHPQGTKQVARYNSATWTNLNSSRSYDRHRGLYADGWTWYPLTPATLKKLISQKRVVQSEAGSRIGLGFAMIVPDDRGVTLGLASGSSRQVQAQARYARYMLKTEGRRKRVRALIPASRSLMNSLERAGFRKTGATIVYERKL